MIVQPVPTGSQVPRRHARLALAAPIGALLLVVAIGMLGNLTTPQAPSRAVPTAAPLEPPAGAAASGPTQPGIALPAWSPATIDGLPVQSVGAALADIAGLPPNATIAVSGFLGVPSPSPDCAADGQRVTLACDRTTLLAAAPWSLGGSEAFASLGPHLHVRLPQGMPMPSVLQGRIMDLAWPVPAVLVGRFGPFLLDGCTQVGAACEREFQLEAIPWADGSVSPVGPLSAAGRRAASAVLGRDAVILRAIRLRRTSLPAIDAQASGQLPSGSGGSPSRWLWYVRGIQRGPSAASDGPTLVWGVVDATTFEVLAREVVGPVVGRTSR